MIGRDLRGRVRKSLASIRNACCDQTEVLQRRGGAFGQGISNRGHSSNNLLQSSLNAGKRRNKCSIPSRIVNERRTKKKEKKREVKTYLGEVLAALTRALFAAFTCDTRDFSAAEHAAEIEEAFLCAATGALVCEAATVTTAVEFAFDTVEADAEATATLRPARGTLRKEIYEKKREEPPKFQKLTSTSLESQTQDTD